jgi:radical SAM protein with 4Fe4S-binding SPASM domain
LFEDKLLFLPTDISIVGVLQFDDTLSELSRQLTLLRKEKFLPNDRIVIVQEHPDQYPYIDGDGKQLIEIQKLVNRVDIGNCFILILTANTNIANEIASVQQDYSFDSTLFDWCVYPGEYEPVVPKYKNTACTHLWNHLYIGTDRNVLPCCVADHRYPIGNIDNQSVNDILDSDNAQNIRQWMIDGYRPKACSLCYKNENNNIKSLRRAFWPKSTKRKKITYLDIRLNNICNFKCRMCSEYFSSSLQQETIEMFGKDAILGYEKIDLTSTNRKTRQSNLEKLLPYVSEDLERIYFAGGEPLITEEHYAILDQLIANNNFNIKMSYNTNLSKLSYKNHNIFDYWKQFSNVSVGASIDGSGSIAEYMRHGTVWQDILNNIAAIKTQTPHVKLTITSTVSWPTLENLIELQTQWLDTNMFNHDQLLISTLTEPSYFSVTTLPKRHKQSMTEKINEHIKYLGQCQLSQQWAELRDFMNNTHTEHELVEFKKRTVMLDQHRNESFNQLFPQFQEFLNEKQ